MTPKTTFRDYQNFYGIDDYNGDIIQTWNNLKNKYFYALIYDHRLIIVQDKNKDITLFNIPDNYWLDNKFEIERHFVTEIRKLKFKKLDEEKNKK